MAENPVDFHLTPYHAGVLAWLNSLEWCAQAQAYPDLSVDTGQPEHLTPPFCLFAVQDWQPAAEQPPHGLLAITLSCVIVVGEHFNTPNAPEAVRNMAMALSAGVHNRRFGVKSKAARFTGAQPEPIPELDEFECWAVQFEQTIELGENRFYAPEWTPDRVMVGITPRIGLGHEPDYVQVNNG